MTTEISILEVLLHGEPIGTLTRLSGDRTLFSFNEAYIQDEDRPVLGLGFKDTLGELITDFRPVQTRVMPFFSNLLPEGSMRTYLAGRAGVKSVREFYLLWALGIDLPGAVTIRSVHGEPWPSTAEQFAGIDQERASGQGALRFSLAGVQLKFSAIRNSRAGLTIPAKGVGGSWIVKLPSREFEGVPENEFSMMQLAGLVGIDVPEVELIELNTIDKLPPGMDRIKGRALAIKRFDRLPDGSSVHIEDFAQVYGIYPEDKYRKASARNIAGVIAAEGCDEDVTEFIRRLTFNVLIGNADMHLKNWSLAYGDRIHASIAPAYDLVSTIAYIPDDGAALKFSRTKRFDGFTEDELSHLAGKAGLPRQLVLDTARETVALFLQHWQAEKANLWLTQQTIDTIESHLKQIPIA